jgi:predicted restriction endonuclease
MYGAALNQYLKYLSEGFNNSVEDDIDEIVGSTAVGETEKAGLIKARIGQGAFRAKLIDLWGSCAVTGYKDLNLLVASHIKPWSVSSNSERLDVYNGLLLVPNLDKAFDSGFISFKESGGIMISPLLDTPEQVGISSGMRIELRTQHLPYLEFHRSNVYRAK